MHSQSSMTRFEFTPRAMTGSVNASETMIAVFLK
jgi:hypothetical protein